MAEPIILCDTEGMTEDEWLACRAHGPNGDIEYAIGGSDVPVILGLSKWATPLDLYKIKKGEMAPPPKKNKKQLEMGHKLEQIAADLYEEKTGDTVINDTFLYQHPDVPYALANFDRRIIRKNSGVRGILECKSTSHYVAGDWSDIMYPPYYEYQLRYYLWMSDLEEGAFSAWWGNNPDTDHVTPRLFRDQRKEDWMVDKLDEFMWRLRNNKPPEMTDIAPKLALQSLAQIYAKGNTALAAVEIPIEFEKELKELAELQSEMVMHNSKVKGLEKEVNARVVRIAEFMKEHEHGILPTAGGRLMVDYVTKSKQLTDSELLKEKYPDIYEETRKTSYSRKVKVRLEAI